MRVRLQSHVVSTIVAALTFMCAAFAGDLNPPAGPVAPTMKPLSEVEPRTAVNSLPGSGAATHVISAPGSYYLTADVVGEPGKNGIVIAASNVTIDLNGFTLRGVPGSLSGVFPNAVLNGVTVRNGVARDWGGTGVNLVNGAGHTVERVVAENNGAHGVVVGAQGAVVECAALSNVGRGLSAGAYSRIVRSSAVDNGDLGVLASNACVVESTTASENGSEGFFGAVGTTFRDCTARSNGTFGFNSSGLVSGCSASDNGSSGFLLQGAAVAADCSATLNGAAGFEVTGNGTIRGCTSSFNTFDGVFVGAFHGVLIEGSTISSNTLSGVFGVANVRVVDCTIANNGTHGVSLQDNAAIERCTISGNGQHGATVQFFARVVGNTFAGNSIDGLRVNGTEGRVEDNDASDNGGVGFNILGGYNLVVRNRASINGTNFSISADNRAGVVESAITATTGPWANFAY